MSQIQVAEDIHIIDHPHGNFWSYSTGVVSQIRSSYTWKYGDGSEHEAKVLQLQTAINPGNSGGPVLDDSGEILGLVAMNEEGQNLDYAIAVDVIKEFLFLGMHAATRSAETVPKGPSLSGIGVSTLSDGRKIWRMTSTVCELLLKKDIELLSESVGFALFFPSIPKGGIPFHLSIQKAANATEPAFHVQH